MVEDLAQVTGNLHSGISTAFLNKTTGIIPPSLFGEFSQNTLLLHQILYFSNSKIPDSFLRKISQLR